MKAQEKTKGFTIIELLVVLGIISVLLSVVLFSISQARSNARDKARVIDIEQMKLNFRLYKEGYGAYPVEDTEIILTDMNNSNLIQLIGNIPTDPSSGSGFGYYYDSSFTCSTAGQRVVFARTMESPEKANFSAVCTDSNPDIGIAGPDSYIVIIE